MKIYKFIILFLIITIFIVSDAYPGDGLSKMLLSIRDVTELTLKNNLDISIERINPEIKDREIMESKSEFDPDLALGFIANKGVKPTASAFASPDVNIAESQTWDIGISQKIITGANYELKFSNEKTKTNSKFAGLNPQHVPHLILSVEQPLLKNFGANINTRNIKIAQNNKKISDNQFKQKVIDIISEAQKAYWDMVFNIEDHKVKQESLKLAQDLEDRVRIHVEVGTMAPIDILQAKAEVASREEDVIMAENKVKNSEDRLKKILNILDSPAAESKQILPADKPIFEEKTLSLEKNLKTAFERRFDLLDAKLELKNKKIDIRYKKNMLFPVVDLKGTFGLNGLTGTALPVTDLNTGSTTSSNFGGSYGDGIERLFSGEYYEWEAGITFRFPIGNRFAKNKYTAAKLEAEKQLIMLKNLEQKISLEVRETVRKIKTNIKRIHATEASRKLAEEKLRAEEERFEVGLSTSFNVLEFQRDLSEEQSKEIRAKTDYKKALIDLERVTAATLERNNVKIR